MNQTAKLDYLINYLLAENPAYRSVAVPDGEGEKRRLLRSLMNLRPPVEISGEFLAVQDDYLRAEAAALRGVDHELRVGMHTTHGVGHAVRSRTSGHVVWV